MAYSTAQVARELGVSWDLADLLIARWAERQRAAKEKRQKDALLLRQLKPRTSLPMRRPIAVLRSPRAKAV